MIVVFILAIYIKSTCLLLIHYTYNFWDYIYIFSTIEFFFLISFTAQYERVSQRLYLINHKSTTWSYRGGWDTSSAGRWIFSQFLFFELLLSTTFTYYLGKFLYILYLYKENAMYLVSITSTPSSFSSFMCCYRCMRTGPWNLKNLPCTTTPLYSPSWQTAFVNKA